MPATKSKSKRAPIDHASDEPSRLKSRRRTKELLAEKLSQLAEAKAIDDRVHELEGKIEEAAFEHVEKCRTIQSEVARIEQTQTFEDTLESLKKLKNRLIEESTRIKLGARDSQVVENSLAAWGRGNPGLLKQLYSAKRVAKFAQARAASAASDVGIQQTNYDHAADYGSDVENRAWQLELARYESDTAAAELSAAQKRINDLFRALIDE